jgi:hypothetical protein
MSSREKSNCAKYKSRLLSRLRNRKAATLLRLESGVDAVCGVLAPEAPPPALLLHACALLRALCTGSECNARLAVRRGVLASVAAAAVINDLLHGATRFDAQALEEAA